MSRTCQHIKVNGGRCGSPALRGRDHCYFHFDMAQRLHRRAANPRAIAALPVLKDENAIQVALMDVMAAILENRIDARRAGLLLWALQIASANCRHVRFRPFSWENPVTRVPATTAENAKDAKDAEEAEDAEETKSSAKPQLPREVEAELMRARCGDLRAVKRLFTVAGLMPAKGASAGTGPRANRPAG